MISCTLVMPTASILVESSGGELRSVSVSRRVVNSGHVWRGRDRNVGVFS
jgi:hypothetical protein